MVQALKFIKNLSVSIRLRSNSVLINESINSNNRAIFVYNGTNNSEFQTLSLVYPEFIFISLNTYTNITVEYSIIYNVDAIEDSTVVFNCSMILKKLH
jgi:hypothetical protein